MTDTSPIPVVLSIQSQVVVGHVGNSAAVPTLWAEGVMPWVVPTTVLAHHPGRGGFRGRVTPGAEVATLLDGVVALPEFATCAGVLSGYLGDPGTPEAIARTVDALRQVRPDAPYLCDPVLGDVDEGLYVHRDLPAGVMEWLLPRATLVTPNAFELAVLTGRTAPPETLEDTLAAAEALRRLGPATVLVTSARAEDGGIGVLLVEEGKVHLSRQPFVEGVEAIKGTGDVLAALVMAEVVAAGSSGWIAPAALDRITAHIAALLSRAKALGLEELPLTEPRSR
jgi:pyridoxine kinase